MPCAQYRGTDYIDEVVDTFWEGSWSAAFREFVLDTQNKWCPPWIRRNYELVNKLDPFTYQDTMKAALAKSRRKKKHNHKNTSFA